MADITLTGGQLGSIVALRRMSEGLMGRLNGSFKEVMVINSTLLAAGIGGIISPQVSSLLHNASTVALSMRNGSATTHRPVESPRAQADWRSRAQARGLTSRKEFSNSAGRVRLSSRANAKCSDELENQP